MIHGYVPHKSDCICVKCEDKRKDDSMTDKKCTCRDMDCPNHAAKPTYSAGDRVTITLNDYQAKCFNTEKDLHDLVLHHEPVKPITHKLTVIKFEDGKYALVSDVGPRAKVIHELLVTFNPRNADRSVEFIT